MKRFSFLIAAAFCTSAASAQYFEVASRLPQLLSPALSGSLNYKGYVELAGLPGVGHNCANFVELSTTQGFKYSSWFFMGVGAGISAAIAQQPDYFSSDASDWQYLGRPYKKTKMMLPLYSDFRFNIGTSADLSFFIDVRLGAAWLLGSGYLRMDDACLTNAAQFYMRPAIGLRIPVSKNSPAQAFNVGVVYQLLTSGNNYYRYSGNVSLSALGVSVSYEW